MSDTAGRKALLDQIDRARQACEAYSEADRRHFNALIDQFKLDDDELRRIDKRLLGSPYLRHAQGC